jgi:uncharacterized protein YecE (DUF72 family)
MLLAVIRVGTCSWADETLTKVWYPPSVKSGEARLRYYAERFDTVEANSTYYRLPDPGMVAGWAERTPPGFVMHVKAFGLMTRHPVRLEQLPPDLREAAATDERGRVDHPSDELRAEVFRRFVAALEPLRLTGRLGGIEFQLPPYIVFRPSSLAYLEWAQAQLAGHELLVEFRHPSWLDETNRAETLAFLEQRGLTFVIADTPPSILPTVAALTSATGYVRFHGRNAATWFKRTRSAAERFDYLYSEDELREWVPQLRSLAERAESVYAMFNNNGRSQIPGPPGLLGAEEETVAQAPTNAAMLLSLLAEG